jgi:hypothetical protein
MRGSALLEELFQLARKQGLTIRREAMSRGVGTGGYCVLKGVPTVFVDDRANIDAQIEVVASVLRRLDWSNVFVHPSVRPVLGLTGDGDTPQREPQPASNDDAQASDQSKKSDSDS